MKIYDQVKDPNGKTRYVLNQTETQIAQGIQAEIEAKFEDWLWSDPERRRTLVAKYNDQFNSVRNREYDGSHISFYGMNPNIHLRKHQEDAIARILYSGNTLLGHVVGAGKTFTMIAAAMKCKQLGKCHKPIFVVPNHLVSQFTSDFMQLYPCANVLMTTEKDFKPENRKKFCARISTGNYDGIVISHTQFEKIPCSVTWQKEMFSKQMEDLMEGIEAVRLHEGKKSYTVKELERVRKQLQVKLDKLNDQSDKDNVLTFEELGVDMLFVDEADLFKNLYVQTKMGNVAGIPKSEAKRASDLFMKTQYLNQLTDYHGVVFATGTPISNSIAELYTMQRYLQYGTLEKLGVEHFDAWAAQFGETVTQLEIAPEGKGLRLKTRFAKFNNLPELRSTFQEVADIRTQDMLDLPLPTAHFEVVTAKPTKEQKEFLSALVERAEAIRNSSVSPDQDNMLCVTNDGKKLALDQRLLDPSLPDNPTGKVSLCADNVFRIWQEGANQKLTQLVFCDTSTPKGAKEATNDSEDLLVEEIIALTEQHHAPSPTGFTNVYEDLRKKLEERGIPTEEIAFIHEANTLEQKKKLFANVRAGNIRVLIGSTQKMGAGTNVQDKLVALHDLDCPWRPRDLEQRLGRIVRQGNKNENVYIYRYVTEQTFDSYLFQTVETKQRAFSQIFTSKTPSRSMDEIDAVALNYAETKALATGNPLIMERAELESDVQKLTVMKKGYLRQKYGMEDYLSAFPAKENSLIQELEPTEKDVEDTEIMRKQLNSDIFPGIIIDGTTYSNREDAAKALAKNIAQYGCVEERTIGQYGCFKLTVYSEDFQTRIGLQNHSRYSVSLYKIPTLTLNAMDKLISEELLSLKNIFMSELESGRKTYAQTKEKLKEPFPQEEELTQKTNRLREVTDLLKNIDSQENSVTEENELDSSAKETNSFVKTQAMLEAMNRSNNHSLKQEEGLER